MIYGWAKNYNRGFVECRDAISARALAMRIKSRIVRDHSTDDADDDNDNIKIMIMCKTNEMRRTPGI